VVEGAGGVALRLVGASRQQLIECVLPVRAGNRLHPEVDGLGAVAGAMHVDERCDDLVEGGGHRGCLEGRLEQHQGPNDLWRVLRELDRDGAAAGVRDDVRAFCADVGEERPRVGRVFLDGGRVRGAGAGAVATTPVADQLVRGESRLGHHRSERVGQEGAVDQQNRFPGAVDLVLERAGAVHQVERTNSTTMST
jgi:hypothetical protein